MDNALKKTVLERTLSVIKEHKVYPLFLAISGSHMWNLNRPDSDIDVRGVYIEPTDKILSLQPPRDTIEKMGIDGLIDMQLYEVKKAFNMLLNNNGNLVELFSSPIKIFSTYFNWQFLVSPFLSKKLEAYYKGYYNSQRKRASINRGGKALVYTYREIFQGIWLMRYGELIHDFRKLKKLAEKDFFKSSLLDNIIKPENWGRNITDKELELFEKEWNELENILRYETSVSKLPEKPPDTMGEELNDWLIELRRRYTKWECIQKVDI